MNLSIKEIAGPSARWVSPAAIPSDPLKGISTDSRRINAGELFVAIKGDRFDGHQYVKSALQSGAAAALVDQRWFRRNAVDYPDASFLVADDALIAYQDIAHYFRKKLNPRVVALTGSAGKTTCKEFIYSVLSQKWHVLRNQKSFNNHVGVPTTLLQLQPKHDILVAELGASDFGEIKRLGRLVEPDVCLILNIGYAHLEHFKSLDGVAKAKMEILENAAADAVAIFNADDALLAKQDYFGLKKITFAVQHRADVKAENVQCDSLGRYSFELSGTRIQLAIPGRHNIYNALAAAAVGLQFDVELMNIRGGIESVDFVEHRMNVSNCGGHIVIDDAYNANPGSCRAALATAADITIPTGGRRIAVLGDMLELGEFSEKEHEKLADAARDNAIDALFLYGIYTKATAARAGSLGVRALHFDDLNVLISELADFIAPHDLILVKGSRSMRMERVVKALIDNEK